MSKRKSLDSQKTYLIVGGIFIALIFLLLIIVGIFGDNPNDTSPKSTSDTPIIGVG